VKKQRAPALPDTATFQQLGDTPGSKLAYSSRESLLYTQGVRGSSPLPPTIVSILDLATHHLNATGLYYYNARFYDPLIGRFISPDTIIPHPATPQSFNRYSYCLNNPQKYTDPYGYWTKMIPISINLGILNIYASGSLSLIWDDNGNWAIVESASSSITSASAVVNITGGYQYTNADTIWDILYGTTEITLSVEAGAGPSIAIEVVTDINGEISGIGGNIGLGGGFSVSGTIEVYTRVLISNRSIERLTDIDAILFGLFLTGEINQQTYVNFYIYSYWYNIDPSELFLWIIMEIAEDE